MKTKFTPGLWRFCKTGEEGGQQEMSDTFEITYGNDDGYAGGSRPHSLEINSDELIDGMDDSDLSDFFWQSIADDFENNHLHLYSEQEAEFVAWAREKIKADHERER